MKNYINKLIYTPLVVLTALSSCKKEKFAEINTDPETLTDIPVEGQFTQGILNTHSGDFEAFYDMYRVIMPFTQLAVPSAGNSKTFISDNTGNANNRYGYFYDRIGVNFVNVQSLINKMTPEEQAVRIYQREIPKIIKVYYAWYVSDINGSIPYTEAFQFRYGGTQTPVYDTQEALFDIWDAELKEVVNTLESTNPEGQISYGNNDLYYKGNVAQWIKAANSLRLKIATRLSKVKPAKLASIATEVLADKGGVFSSIEDDWVFIGNNGWTGGGNWNPSNLRASKSLVDFMLAQEDPRLKLFFAPNDYSEENFNALKAAGQLPANAVWNPNRYVGAYASPDEVAARPSYYRTRKVGDNTIDTLSSVQFRLFQAEYNYGSGQGTGFTSFPILTYADICFIRAELAAKGITNENAADWYEKGVIASIKAYDKMAATAKILNYEAVSDADITNYLAQPEIKYNPAKAMEQIASQAFLNYFKNPNEAWALLKRTDLPNANTALKMEVLKADATTQVIPRRAALRVLNPGDGNYENNKAALDQMRQLPDFGQGASDVFGRVWWDVK